MNHNLKVPSLQSLIESDRGSNDSLLADSIQLDIEEVCTHLRVIEETRVGFVLFTSQTERGPMPYAVRRSLI